MIASRMRLNDIVNILIRHNANVCYIGDIVGTTALHCAARECYKIIVFSLLRAIQHSANGIGCSLDGYIELELVLMHQQRSVVDILLQNLRKMLYKRTG